MGSRVLVLVALLALPALAVVPTAAADRCGFQDPTLEPVLCGAYAATFCVRYALDEPKKAPERLALCDSLLLP